MGAREQGSPASRDMSEVTEHTAETTFSELATGRRRHEKKLERHAVSPKLKGKSWAALTSGIADCGWDSR